MRSLLYKKIKLFAPVAVSLAIVLLPTFVAIAAPGGSVDGRLSPGGSVDGGLSPGGSVSDSPFTLQNPLGVDSLCKLIGLLLKAAIAIGIPIAVLFIVYAGFKFIMARGSPGELTEARANLMATLIGIAIFVGASLIAGVIIATIEQLGVNNISSC